MTSDDHDGGAVSGYCLANHKKSDEEPRRWELVCGCEQTRSMALRGNKTLRMAQARCLIPRFNPANDDKSYKTLRRHFPTIGMTPAEYRERYNLKADYLMVAATYLERRRAMAKKTGLGRKPGQSNTAKKAFPKPEPRKRKADDAEKYSRAWLSEMESSPLPANSSAPPLARRCREQPYYHSA